MSNSPGPTPGLLLFLRCGQIINFVPSHASLSLELLGFACVLSPPICLIWAWMKTPRERGVVRAAGWRRTLGLSGLWVFTGQVLAGFLVAPLINARYPYPLNFQPFRIWARIVLVATLVVVVLSCLGKTRARAQIVAGSVATWLFWAVMASMD
jgi:FtsH-binding integral membrane protein